MTKKEYLNIANDYAYGIYIGACNGCPYADTTECNSCKYSTDRYLTAQKEYYEKKETA